MQNERDMVAGGEVCVCCSLSTVLERECHKNLFHLSCTFLIAVSLLCSEDGGAALGPSCSSSGLLLNELLLL